MTNLHMVDRPYRLEQLSTPGAGGGVRVVPVILVEAYDEGDDSSFPKDVSGGLGNRPTPNFARLGDRDYGMRVGIFRMLSLFEEIGVPINVAIDRLSLHRYGELLEILQDKGANIVLHGEAAGVMMHEEMAADDERTMLASVIEEFESKGLDTRAWLSPEYQQSSRTARNLSELGVQLMMDWGNSDSVSRVDGLGLLSLPLMPDYDDAFALVTRGRPDVDFYHFLVEAAQGLEQTTQAESLTVLGVALRPWVSGHAHRVPLLRNAFIQLAQCKGVRFSSPQDIIDACQGAHMKGEPDVR